ncbi:hypothetical protein B2G69_04495 [Methylorubrum zatmanii]|nr:hypothetical protein B2G69_04495 [Methylorubrum zatmanii]
MFFDLDRDGGHKGPSPRLRGEGFGDHRTRVFPSSDPRCPSRAGPTWVVAEARRQPKVRGRFRTDMPRPEPPPHHRFGYASASRRHDRVPAGLSPRAGRGGSLIRRPLS